MTRICIKTDSNITTMELLNNSSIAICTQEGGLKILSSTDCTIEKELLDQKLLPDVECYSFSKDGKYLAFYTNNSISLLYIPSGIITLNIPINNEKVDILSFDLSSTYLIVGTDQGRVYQYRNDSGSILSRVCSFPYERPVGKYTIQKNFVSAFAFYQNKLASTGYDGAIIIVDLISQANTETITHSRVPIDALCFTKGDTIISGNRDGAIFITSLSDTNAYKQVNCPFMNIKQIIMMPDSNFIMVHAQTNYATIIDIKNLKIMHHKYLKFESDIKQILLLNENYLIVALQNAKILKIKLSNIDEFKQLTLDNSFEDAYKLLANNPMLKNTTVHQNLEKKYDKIYQQATVALIKENKKFAIQLTDIFKNVPSKTQHIKLLFRAFENYPQFKELYVNKKTALFYAMSSKYPALEKTIEYKRMEDIWKQNFSKAQREVILGKKEQAKATLKDYISINSKRSMIHLIVNNNTLFLKFLKAIEKKDFHTAYLLAQKNDTFSQIPSFLALDTEIQSILTEISTSIYHGDTTLATDKLKALQGISSIYKKLNTLQDKCSNMLKLQKAYKIDNFRLCYEILDTYPYLKDTELGILLEKHFSTLIQNCETFAIQGEIKAIKNTLKELIEIQSRRDKIGDILRVSFQTKISSLIKLKSFKNSQSLIYLYIDIFGVDKEIYLLIKRLEDNSSIKLVIAEEQNTHPDRDNWIHSKIIMT